MKRHQCTRISVYKQHFPCVEGNGETFRRDVWMGISDTMRLTREQPSQISERHNQLGFDNLFNEGSLRSASDGTPRFQSECFISEASGRRSSLSVASNYRGREDGLRFGVIKLEEVVRQFWRGHLHLSRHFLNSFSLWWYPRLKKKKKKKRSGYIQ